MNSTKMKSQASVFLRGGHLIINTQNEAVTGVLIASNHVFVLAENDTKENIGLMILKALALSKRVPHPKAWKNIGTPLFKAAGVRSWKKFADGTKYVNVMMQDNKITLCPYHNRGTKDGFVSVGIEIESSQKPQEIGAALMNAFEHCS